MRIFIGIKLADALLEEMDKFLKPFKKIGTPIKWTKRVNTHITLKFIGEVSPKKYAQIENLLAETDLNAGALDLKLTGCGTFGRKDELSIFWVGISQNSALEDIFNRVESSLEKAGIEKDKRSFKPHITIGRNKKSYNFKSFYNLVEEYRDHFIADYTVTHLQLFRSQLTPQGPIYTILKEIPLVTA